MLEVLEKYRMMSLQIDKQIIPYAGDREGAL